jgi:hypothetical protein
MKKFEYKTFDWYGTVVDRGKQHKEQSIEELKRLGHDGYDFVAIIPANAPNWYNVIMKREIEEE